MAREYFCAYHSYLDAIEPLNDAERGRLFTACLEYSMTGVAPDLRGNERFLFPALRSQIDRDAEKYILFSEKQAENGKKGGRPKNPELLPGTQKTQPFFEEPKKTKEKEKEKTKEKNTLPYGFEEFWGAYPKKQSKPDAIKAYRKISPDGELLNRILQALENHKKSESWNRDNKRYIPYPATWLNRRQWEDELEGDAVSKRRMKLLD